MIVSLGYETPAAREAYTIRILFVGRAITNFDSDTPEAQAQGVDWQQTVAEVTATRIYLKNLAVPISETSGNPYSLVIETEGRTTASTLVVDWEWGRAVRDTDMGLAIALAGLKA